VIRRGLTAALDDAAADGLSGENAVAVDVPHRTFISEVAAVVDITPRLRQITFHGGLDDYESLGGDEFLYVLLPPRGRHVLTIDTDFSWSDVDDMPEPDRPAGAYYSVRRWRPEQQSLDMWFVVHGDEGAASAWASRATPGQPVGLWGPRRSFAPPVGTGSYLFVADETGFGAVASLLEQLLVDDPDVSVRVIAEADGDAGRVALPRGPGIRVRWLDRAGRAPGSTSLLLDAVRNLEVNPGVYAFGAGESRRITAVRQYLRNDVGLDTQQVVMTGYWRSA
jgi:NADPH-dependent ferric siderophore reductase